MTTGNSTDPSLRLSASWDDNADRWTRLVRSGGLVSRRTGTDHAILAAVARSGARRVFDLGCGEGWLSHRLAAEGHAVTGCDGAVALIAAAEEWSGDRCRPAADAMRLKPAPHFDCCGYDDLIEQSGRCAGPFDAVVANFSLLHDPIAPLLRALVPRLAAGGVLLIQTIHPLAVAPPYADGWREEDFRALAGGRGEAGDDWTPMPWFFRTLSGWSAALSASGFCLRTVAEPRAPVQVDRDISGGRASRGAAAIPPDWPLSLLIGAEPDRQNVFRDP